MLLTSIVSIASILANRRVPNSCSVIKMWNRIEKMASNAQRALRQSWQVTEKANPFMSKSGTKTTQKRGLNDMMRQQQPSNSNANSSILPNFLGRSFKKFLADTKGDTVNWAAWETTLRSNIARLVREEEKRETAFKQMMHRF